MSPDRLDRRRIACPARRRCRRASSSRTSDGAREARTDIRASSASWSSVSSWAARMVAYWPASRDPNSSGSSAPRATVAPASSSCGQRHGREVGVDAERHVGDRADLERDAPLDDPLEQGGVLGRRGRRGRAGRRAGRRGRCARTRAPSARRRAAPARSPARSAIAKAGAKSAVVPAPLVVGQPEADDAAVGVLHRQPGQGPGVQRVPGAVGGDDHRDAEAGALARRRARSRAPGR